ncbi:hypothetical protein [Nocardioides sp. YIM 152588]|uniref:hypothetical protein n=1 Tax=Nocardioides sp. YIM 152588 TaxID=3158259 RepID=UPI0032E38B9B
MPRGERRARSTLLETEAALRGDLVEGALDAGSGALAQVLASMATAVAQRLVVLG